MDTLKGEVPGINMFTGTCVSEQVTGARNGQVLHYIGVRDAQLVHIVGVCNGQPVYRCLRLSAFDRYLFNS